MNSYEHYRRAESNDRMRAIEIVVRTWNNSLNVSFISQNIIDRIINLVHESVESGSIDMPSVDDILNMYPDTELSLDEPYESSNIDVLPKHDIEILMDNFPALNQSLREFIAILPPMDREITYIPNLAHDNPEAFQTLIVDWLNENALGYIGISSDIISRMRLNQGEETTLEIIRMNIYGILSSEYYEYEDDINYQLVNSITNAMTNYIVEISNLPPTLLAEAVEAV